MTMRWWSETASGFVLALHVQPGAKKSGVAGYYGEALKVRLAAPALEGKANAALLAWLAKTLSVPQRALTIASGERARDKRVRVEVGPENRVALRARLATLLPEP